MKSTWFADRTQYEFAKCLRDADYSRWGSDLFHIFLDCAAATLMQANRRLMGLPICEKTEQEYMQAISGIKYPDKMAMAMGLLIEGLEQRACDFLGSVFMALGANDTRFRGQCFTPDSLSHVIPAMIFAGCQPDKTRTIWISEPACGGGSMVIGAFNHLVNHGWGPRDFHFWATDVDRRCFAMTFIQTTLLDIPCIVEHGNSLTLKTTRRERNMASLLHPPRNWPDAEREETVDNQGLPDEIAHQDIPEPERETTCVACVAHGETGAESRNRAEVELYRPTFERRSLGAQQTLFEVT